MSTRSRRIALDAVAWASIHAASAGVAAMLPASLYQPSRWLWRPHPPESERLYRHHLRVMRWKHRLPDAAAWIPGGFPKRSLRASDSRYLEQFATETGRAELGHWLALAAWPLLLIWDPPRAAPVHLAYAVAANLPCIAAQRFNRHRIVRVLGASEPRLAEGGPGPA